MSLVKVKTKGQVTIPDKIREENGVAIGDFLKAEWKNGKITLTPQTLIDRDIAESLEDFKNGRSYGPFHNANDLIASLKKNLKKKRKK